MPKSDEWFLEARAQALALASPRKALGVADILKLQHATRTHLTFKGSRKNVELHLAKKQAGMGWDSVWPSLLSCWGILYGLSLSPSGSLENELLYIYLLSES